VIFSSSGIKGIAQAPTLYPQILHDDAILPDWRFYFLTVVFFLKNYPLPARMPSSIQDCGRRPGCFFLVTRDPSFSDSPPISTYSCMPIEAGLQLAFLFLVEVSVPTSSSLKADATTRIALREPSLNSGHFLAGDSPPCGRCALLFLSRCTYAALWCRLPDNRMSFTTLPLRVLKSRSFWSLSTPECVCSVPLKYFVTCKVSQSMKYFA